MSSTEKKLIKSCELCCCVRKMFANSFGHLWEPRAEKNVRVVNGALARSDPVEAHYYSAKIGKRSNPSTDIDFASWTPMKWESTEIYCVYGNPSDQFVKSVRMKRSSRFASESGQPRNPSEIEDSFKKKAV